ncbi:GPP34 family phosphoprotein [Fictibacillus enclensis]|uniref:GPP34 family phosphoprotein n=1 Tax=Fictibacillus enclensis TaxID=1017270 RepID=UPI0024BFFFD6|nr:GPP34 family phosphoprotein [Fictibacillus enclensis]WHY74746.1 GPP34 family phosphoprotein [Fictibacillus enclensis]
MENMGISQRYLLLSLNDKGGVAPVGSLRIRSFLIASGILELIMEDVILLLDNQVTVNQELPKDKEYLRIVYNRISQEKSVHLKKLARELATNRKLFKELFNSIGDTLVDLNVVTKTNGGILGHSTQLVGGEEDKKNMVEQLRAELLEEGPVTTDTVVLSSLLIGNHTLKHYFSEFEEQELKDKISSLRKDTTNKEIFAMVDGISRTITTIIASVG